tara:strand:- start:313 stop:1167 length:855 start_codon:yes stop_codon:yes gene_type:complete
MTFEVNNLSEAMRIDSSGNLLVGKTSNDNTTNGFVLDANGTLNAVRSSEYLMRLNRTSTDGEILRFQKNGASVGSIGTYFGDLYIASPSSTDAGIGFGGSKISPTTTTGSLRDAAIDLGQSAGRFKDLYLSGGAYLGGTASANHLDDYEEGSWEPTLIGTTVNPTVTYHTDTGGFYIKIGRLVYVTATIRTTAISGGSGTLMVGGFPFSNSARSNGDNSDGIGAVRTNLWNGTSTTIPTTVQSQRQEARAYLTSGGYDQVNNLLSVSSWGSTCMMTFTLVYYTS